MRTDLSEWSDGVEPVWSLLEPASVAALRAEPSAANRTLRLAADLPDEAFGESAFVRNALILLDPAVIAALIEAGADTEAHEPLFGMTPLHRAAAHNKNPAVAAAVLEAGANPRAKANNGKMPIDFAIDNDALKGSKVYWRLNDASFGD